MIMMDDMPVTTKPRLRLTAKQINSTSSRSGSNLLDKCKDVETYQPKFESLDGCTKYSLLDNVSSADSESSQSSSMEMFSRLDELNVCEENLNFFEKTKMKDEIDVSLLNLDQLLDPFVWIKAPLSDGQAGELFAVNVSLAISPTYFVVQPVRSSAVLRDMSNQMNQYYRSSKNCQIFNVDQVEVGLIFAAKPKYGTGKDQWFRAKITEILTCQYCMAILIDYGDLELVEISEIRKLDYRFFTLPRQSVNARLTGIIPSAGSWRSDDTEWWRSRVEEKRFTAQVTQVCEVGGEIMLEIILCDKNGEADKYLQDELIEKGCAYIV